MPSPLPPVATCAGDEGGGMRWESTRKKRVVLRVGYVGTEYRGLQKQRELSADSRLPGISTATTRQVFEQHFKPKPTATFEDFHIAYVEFCNYFNTIMPGQDFDTPSRDKIKEFYDKEWEVERDPEEKKTKFLNFITTNVKEAPVDDKFFIMAGLAAPAAAVIGKRASKNIPYVKNLKLEYVPNVVFVPLFTLGAIIAATAAQISSRKSAMEADKEKKEEKSVAEQKKKKNGEANAS